MILIALASVALILGSILLVAAAWGLLRFPDVLCRAHALTKAAGLGLVLFLIGMALALRGEGERALVAILFQFATIPLAGHLIAIIAFRRDIERHRKAPAVPLPGRSHQIVRDLE